ncbi:PilZ domain-containing protein [Wenzhouxiangella sp. AB-CW3]|uniref:PilZ domain-containing protein n=1 Tax=Wenzhouxiangella sp. AB-CW3 TaxID=2771012 RepID=UPI00168BA9D1|nr:PilZ domain-containing protein [Wenzhouxiangella sp. AB-CW3]QOC22252.1 PilZ domain-containing protein [Wenzhouxiangella sp. AB-CW3]
MNDRRAYDRRHSIIYLQVFDRDSGSALGNLVDISEKGVMLVSKAPMENDQQYALRMHLPEPVNGNYTVDFEAVVRWCRQDINPDLYDIGFELINPPKSFEDALESLVKGYMFTGN